MIFQRTKPKPSILAFCLTYRVEILGTKGRWRTYLECSRVPKAPNGAVPYKKPICNVYKPLKPLRRLFVASPASCASHTQNIAAPPHLAAQPPPPQFQLIAFNLLFLIPYASQGLRNPTISFSFPFPSLSFGSGVSGGSNLVLQQWRWRVCWRLGCWSPKPHMHPKWSAMWAM